MTARTYDINGWFEVADNPISREGVYPYSGGQIGAPAHEAARIFRVYRPGEELGDPETIDSFRLMPIIDDHTMLGAGFTPAEAKGVAGVIGEDIRFAGGVLRANLKIFSSALAEKIKNGKTELSCGYRCTYEFTPGVWRGQEYDAVQRTIRGNHLALVDEGRMGPEVAVLDQMVFTVDAKEIPTVDEELKKMLEDLAARIAKLEAGEVGEKAPVTDADGDKPAAEASTEEKPVADADGDKPPVDAPTEEKPAAMDAALKKLSDRVEALAARPAMDEKAVMQTIAKKADLADRLSRHVGTFDHAAMTYADVVAYGVDKLKLKVTRPGAEDVALDAYLQARALPAPIAAHGMDKAPKGLSKSILSHYGA